MKKIKDIKAFFDRFAKVEAETEILKWKWEYKDYNMNIDKANSFYLPPYFGFMPYDDERDEDDIDMFGKDFFNTPVVRHPRKIFKISEHINTEHGKFWICYTSSANHSNTASSFLSDMLFVIEKDNKLKIAAESLWSNYEKDGWGDEKHKWHHSYGAKHLHYDYLKEPEDIERYEAPEDYKIGLKIYHENI